MLYPVENSLSWSLKYDIKVKEGLCPSCGKEVVANRPFADASLRGFISEDHGCGINNCLITFKCLSDKEFWIKVAQGADTPYAL